MNKIFFQANWKENIYINHRGYDINNFNRRFLELFIELLLQ